MFFTQSVASDLSKKKIFTFDLSAEMESAEVGPGDTVAVSPVIFNSATEQMYVYIVVQMPTSPH